MAVESAKEYLIPIVDRDGTLILNFSAISDIPIPDNHSVLFYVSASFVDSGHAILYVFENAEDILEMQKRNNEMATKIVDKLKGAHGATTE